MAANSLRRSQKSATVPTLSDILMSLTDVKGAVACALGKIEHHDSDATGTLTIALDAMERTQEQIEELQRQLGSALSGADTAGSTSAAPAASADAIPEPVRVRIATLRERMFTPMAAVHVASEAVDHEDVPNTNLNRLLGDAYWQLDKIALALWEMCGNAEPEVEGAEVAHE